MSSSKKSNVTLAGCLFALPFIIAWFLFLAWLLQFVFNIVAPVFGWPVLTYSHAVALCALLSLIGGFFRK